jgi:nucleoside-diphosphate-sugar epimerase
MSHFLLTGINGFIGSHVAERLVNDGHKVRGIVRKSSDLKRLKGLTVELLQGNITNKQSIEDALKDIDIVIHIAGLASDWGTYRDFFEVNVEGTRNVAMASRDHNVKRFVYMSSAAIFGFQNCRYVSEESPLPDTIFNYCQTKKQAEQWLLEFSASNEMELVILRPGNVFGPYDHTFIEQYLDTLLERKMIYIDKGKHWTCPIYVTNLSDAVVRACFEPKAAGEAIILTDGYEIDWKMFTGKLATELGIKPPKWSVPFHLAYFMAFLMEVLYKVLRIKSAPLLTRYRISNGGRDYHFSIEKAISVLQFKPAIALDEAIRQTVSWYKRHRKIKL